MTAKNQSYGPQYYNRGSIEVWDFIRDQKLSYHLGNAIKYICRYGHKGDYNAQLSDLNKAIHYLENELDNEKDIYFRASQGIPYQVRAEVLQDSRQTFLSEESDRRGI